MSRLLLGRGTVGHSRHEGAKNKFRYPLFFLQFCCDEEAELRALFRRKFRFLLGLRSSDYLDGREGTLVENAKAFLKENCQYEAEEIWLHTLPRMFGYVFNPVSFWLCKKAGRLEAVLVEVRNTFGEKHFYWIAPDSPISSRDWLRAEKVFHVSPFFPVEGHYLFRFHLEPTKTRIDINYHESGLTEKLRLATWVEGRLENLEKASAWPLVFRYGWMTPMVVFRIHFQAVRLWLKKTRFYSKPALPEKKVTL